MLDPKLTELLSDKFEAVCEKRFKKLGYSVEWLDTKRSKRMPEFLVSDSSGPVLICEVKTILSGGFLHERNAHLSSLDDNLADGEVFELSLDKRKVDEDLTDAVNKYRALVEKRPHLGRLPMVVAFSLDFFAGQMAEYPSCMDAHPEISGILEIVSNRRVDEWASQFSLDELRRRIEENDLSGQPKNTKEFILSRNLHSRMRLPRDFVSKCWLRK